MTQQTFAVQGLRCEGCVDTITKALLSLPGVTSVEITLVHGAPSPVQIEADRVLDRAEVQAALSAHGDFPITS